MNRILLECNNYGNHSRSDLHKVCEAALSASRNVIFAGLVNANGILVVGKYRYEHHTKISKLSPDHHTVNVSKGCDFYLERLLPYLMATKGISEKGSRRYDNPSRKDGERIELELLNIDGKVKTAITKIPELQNLFLCVEYISG